MFVSVQKIAGAEKTSVESFYDKTSEVANLQVFQNLTCGYLLKILYFVLLLSLLL